MSASQTPTPFLSDRTYQVLKWIAQIFLPALGTLYFTLAGIWDLPKAEEIVGTITAVDLFLGLLLNLSSKVYQKSDARFDGSIDVLEVNDEGGRINMNVDPIDVYTKREVTFKVNNELAQ